MEKQIVTLTGTAVAIVALARFLAAGKQDLALHLSASLAQAEAVGLEADDLALLQTIIAAVSLPASHRSPARGPLV